MRRVAGSVIVAAGLCLMLFPFASVWRVTGEALDQLPDVEATATDTDRKWAAMFSDEFVLATRAYRGPPGQQVVDALADNGFQLTSASGSAWWTRECCGDYDAVWIRVEERGDGWTLAVVSVYDDDIQASWPFISMVGLVISFFGVALARIRQRESEHDPDELAVIAQ